MKLIYFILFIAISIESSAMDDFVITYGDVIQPRNGQVLDEICYMNKEYSVVKSIHKEILTQKIEVKIHNPWFKLAYKGLCTGLPFVKSEQALLEKDSVLNLEYTKNGIVDYSGMIENFTHYDSNLEDFYALVKASDFEPIYNTESKKWPLGGGVYLVEQCFTVAANINPFPSNKNDFVFGQKYTQIIIDKNSEKVIVDTGLDLTFSFCECDGNPPPACQSINEVTDINGNGKYEIKGGTSSSEGERLILQEYDGLSLSPVYEMCTGDYAYPLFDFSCPKK